jgi:hypothetical protein
MNSPCIHAFRSDECAACRTCPHGLVSSRCGRCLKAVSTPALRQKVISAPDVHPAEEHAGFEIVFVPALNGWQIRADGAAASTESYRSVFLARKAVDGSAAVPTHAGSRRRVN